jgi:predicted cobalt transporter CbtA
MKVLTFLAITLVSGAIAGTILGIINQVIVEPYIDKAIDIEIKNAAITEGKVINPSEMSGYRIWQKGGEIVAGTILGTSLSALFGIVFIYIRTSLPGSSNKKKALALAGIIYLVLFIIPALKYPANPPAVGDPETIYYRQTLYVTFIVISGFSALMLAFIYRTLGNRLSIITKNIIFPLIYAAIIAGAYLALPPNPDKITNVSMDLVQGFRISSVFTMGIFWGMIGIIFGSMWDRFKPHETANSQQSKYHNHFLFFEGIHFQYMVYLRPITLFKKFLTS